jgi:hypothetical protein
VHSLRDFMFNLPPEMKNIKEWGRDAVISTREFMVVTTPRTMPANNATKFGAITLP